MTEISKYLTNPQIHQIHQLQKPVVWILRSKRVITGVGTAAPFERPSAVKKVMFCLGLMIF